MKKDKKLPRDWDDKRVQKILTHYQTQTEDEAVAEDEAAYGQSNQVMMEIPKALVPVVRELIAKHRDSRKAKMKRGR